MSESRELPAGTLVHINGIPCWLTEPAKLETHRANWDLVLEQQPLSEIESDADSVGSEKFSGCSAYYNKYRSDSGSTSLCGRCGLSKEEHF